MTDRSGCKDCSAGKYCLGNACPDDRDDVPAELAKIIPCAKETGDCLAGYWCEGGSSNPKQHIVTQGHWSAAGAVKEEDCEPGWYQSGFGSTECTKCPPGTYCPDPAMTLPLPCEPGHYCGPDEGQTEQMPCPVGTYSKLEGLQKEEDCWDCQSGKYCDSTG